MKAWDQMTAIEQKRAEYSDLHKDTFGYRPSMQDFERVAKLTDDEYMKEYTYLAELMSRQDN
jgi:hypothetical protein